MTYPNDYNGENFAGDFDGDYRKEDSMTEEQAVEAYKDQHLSEQIDEAFAGCKGPFVEQLKDVLFDKIDKYYSRAAYNDGVKVTIIEMIKNNI